MLGTESVEGATITHVNGDQKCQSGLTADGDLTVQLGRGLVVKMRPSEFVHSS